MHYCFARESELLERLAQRLGWIEVRGWYFGDYTSADKITVKV